MKNLFRSLLAGVLLIGSAMTAQAHSVTTPNSPIHITPEGKVVYKAYDNGDRVPDFSFCGYRASEAAIPFVAARVVVPAAEGDMTGRIQAAIDHVSSLPVDANGFRGAVLLEKGTYTIDGSLTIRASGVVLRGTGPGGDETVLIGAGVTRETLIRVAGDNNRRVGEAVKTAAEYIPVNASVIPMPANHGFRKGDRVMVTRPSTAPWLKALGTDKLGNEMEYNWAVWRPGTHNIVWDRTVVAADENSITLDVPLTNALDPQYGGGTVAKYTFTGRINNVGVENLRLVSQWDTKNEKDENHRWMAVTLESVEDAWVRRVFSVYFVSSTVAVWENARRVTVEDCKSLEPVSEIANLRRYAFQTRGQQTLFQRCYSEYGYHDFSVWTTTPGPNAFVQCLAYLPYSFSGAIGGWANGILFDKTTIDGGVLSYGWLDMDGGGAGWTAANSLMWQCRVAQTKLVAPPTAMNWAYGMWTEPFGNGHYELSHTFITQVESIFYDQLISRTGRSTEELKKIYAYTTDETVAPMPEYAAWMSELSKTPQPTMYEWIDEMIAAYPLPSETGNPTVLTSSAKPAKPVTKAPEMTIDRGWISRGNKVMIGGTGRGTGSLTLYSPGREATYGTGETIDLDTLGVQMSKSGPYVLWHGPDLWYERRRGDHERNRQADANVIGPFSEMPFSRSGIGEAWDRLSKYDLDQYNPWYYERVKKFGEVSDQYGFAFFNEHYLQHNIIEEGAHWVDYPWRSANNINDLGFPEPPRMSGDKRIFMGVEFYDVDHPVRRAYHEKYIRQSVNNVGTSRSTIQSLSFEFTGPKHFVDFWVDVIKACENEHDRNELICITATKDVTDAILADPARGGDIDVIDIRKWFYREDGTVFAPEGGQSLTWRQYVRLNMPAKSNFQGIYSAVREYRDKYPDKAVVYNADLGNERILGEWAVLIAGGSLAKIPAVNHPDFGAGFAAMKPVAVDPSKQWGLGAAGTGYLFYGANGAVTLDLPGDNASYVMRWIDPATGAVTVAGRVKSGQTLKTPEKPAILWLNKK